MAASQDQVQEGPNDMSASGGECYDDNGGDQLMELNSFGSHQQTPKLRKPYTITKQREKWTEEEHQKFLDALKLYGRGWRKIQGVNNTPLYSPPLPLAPLQELLCVLQLSVDEVLLLSLLQNIMALLTCSVDLNFQVVRDTTGVSESSLKPIEIPPPRPKRKPSHPYPRKCIDAPERSESPNLLGMEKGNNSPTSVLSVVGSEALGSPASEMLNRCSSLTSCTSDVQSFMLLPHEKESEPIVSDVSPLQENTNSSPEGASSDPMMEKFLTNSEDGSNNATLLEAEGAVPMARSKSFKLFGRTVLVMDSEKHVVGGSQANVDMDHGIAKQKSSGIKLSLGLANHDLNGLPLSSFHTEVKRESAGISETDCSLPAWSLFDGLSKSSRQSFTGDNSKEKDTVDERCCSGSDAGSTNEVEKRERSMDVGESQRQMFTSNARSNSMRGFVPYKRCLAERDMKSSLVASEERDQQRARVCS
ncbi:unnamed protein product [Linum tenue]|uniref:HTH myb-type domain-containing protein n=1 Tax=Linum tenue TaxID=586396 RepID=A0AAV0IRW9_9ROSI|nr:unnamed protein product [Linum tenue]